MEESTLNDCCGQYVGVSIDTKVVHYSSAVTFSTIQLTAKNQHQHQQVSKQVSKQASKQGSSNTKHQQQKE